LPIYESSVDTENFWTLHILRFQGRSLRWLLALVAGTDS
jgi:hypothetical protein